MIWDIALGIPLGILVTWLCVLLFLVALGVLAWIITMPIVIFTALRSWSPRKTWAEAGLGVKISLGFLAFLFVWIVGNGVVHGWDDPFNSSAGQHVAGSVPPAACFWKPRDPTLKGCPN